MGVPVFDPKQLLDVAGVGPWAWACIDAKREEWALGRVETRVDGNYLVGGIASVIPSQDGYPSLNNKDRHRWCVPVGATVHHGYGRTRKEAQAAAMVEVKRLIAGGARLRDGVLFAGVGCEGSKA